MIRDAPPAPYVDVTTEQRKALEGNLKNLGDLSALGGRTQAALDEETIAMLRRFIPNWDEIAGNIGDTLASESRGEVPQDVQDFLSRKSAELGISAGTAGSQFDKYRTARNLGLTSLQLADKAIDSTSRWMAAVKSGAPRFDFTSMFQTPAQRIQTGMWNEQNRWNVAWLETQLKAQPSNAEQAYAQIADYVADYATMAASVYGNKAMGGGGAAAGGGGGAGMYGGGSSWG